MKHWYKNAVIYSLDVETYLDSNQDGIGDFTGLSRCLEYLAGLGVTCVWLLPFYPSPNRDNGYDVKEYYGVDPRLGNLGGFVEFMNAAEERNIRVLVDLVVNHTSVEHPWFQEARKDRNSKYRNYYVWVDEPIEEQAQYPIFGERQEGNWAYDEEAGQYYYHTFYQYQPDLNLTNPEVRKEIRKIMRFWLKLGVSGFRMDAVPHMIRAKGHERFESDPHDVLREFRRFVEEQKSDAVLLAEVDVEPERYTEFFGDGDQMHMLFNFYLDNYLFLAFARESAEPIARALDALPRVSDKSQYATFLRNHDELDLERLSDTERQEVFDTFAPDESMRLFGRGIRRRLAPMFGGDRRRLELAHSLLLTLPGSPVIRYGDEIGMGEDLSLKERNSVRTPMQWSNEQNAGFSTAPSETLALPVINEGPFGYPNVNVNDQRRDRDSLLNWLERAIRLRKECPEFGWGDYEVLDVGTPEVLVHIYRWKHGVALAAHNLSGKDCTVELDLTEEDTADLLEVFGDQAYEAFEAASGKLRLGGYGYRWFRKSFLHTATSVEEEG